MHAAPEATTEYYWGNEIDRSYCWYNENGKDDIHCQVGQKKPNNFGLYDMSGNVYEWCTDWEGKYLPGQSVNPAGPPDGKNKIVRGGSTCGWQGGGLYCDEDYCRSARRQSQEPQDGYCNTGFRIVKSK